MSKESVGQPLPSPFVVKFNTVIGRDFTDPVYKHLEHDGYPIIFKQERERLMSANGITLQKLESDFGIRAFVRQLNITYKVPVMAGDQVTLETSLTMPRPFAIEFHHLMQTGDIINAQADCLYIVTNLDNKPIRIPQNLVRLLEQIGKVE